MARAYRTVGFAAACALASTPPWELEAWVLARVYEWTAGRRARGERPAPEEREAIRREARDAIVVHWTGELATAAFGRRTLDAIGPVLRDWLERSHGFLTFRLVQVLSGHGCFGSYLHRIGREETPSCHDCGAVEDTAQHTLEVCPSWSETRRSLIAVIGPDLSLPGLVNAMLEDERSWVAIASFCEHVMSQKEAAERAREDDPHAASLRRRRRGRRRRQFDSHLRLLPGGDQQATGAGAPLPVLHRPPPVSDGNGQVFPAIPVAPQPGGHVGPAS